MKNRELIERIEKLDRLNGDSFNIEKIKIISLVEQLEESPKAVIPQSVADWIEFCIEAEKLYRISMPQTENYKGHIQVLCEEKDHLFWCGEWKRFKTEFTKKRLEKAGFGELFDSKLFHVEEVKDGRLD